MKKILETFFMPVRQQLIEKLKGKFEKNSRKHSFSEIVPLIEKLRTQKYLDCIQLMNF